MIDKVLANPLIWGRADRPGDSDCCQVSGKTLLAGFVWTLLSCDITDCRSIAY